MITNNQPRFTFDRKLSLDGVAFILGLVAALLWVGRLQEKMEVLQDQGVAHAAKLEEIGQSVEGVKSDVAVLKAVVDERTGKSLK